MITKDQILELNKKELEALLNTTITGLTKTSIEPTEVKQLMFETLSKQMGDDVNVKYIDYHYNNLRISFDMLSIEIKVSVKGTGKIKKVTKLKSKEVKGVGGFKISEITHAVNGFCYEIDDKSKWSVKIEEGVWCSGDVREVYLTGFKDKIGDMLNTDFLVAAIDKQENDFYEERKRWGSNNNSPWKGLRHSISESMIQPIVKPLFLNKISVFYDKIVEKEKLNDMPEPFYSKLNDIIPIEEVFGVILNVVSEINSDLIDDVIKNRLFTNRD